MNKLAGLIANGTITVEELAGANDLIERAELVTKGLEACKKTIVFPLGSSQIACYSYVDHAGEYEAWGHCTTAGIFTCYNNWGGNHVSGQVNLANFSDVFLAFENEEFVHDLRRFLNQQIEKAAAS